jgi:hypothetical protein
MKVEDILNHVIPHGLSHVCEPCENFENFHFKKDAINVW